MRKVRQIQVHRIGDTVLDGRSPFVTAVPGVEAPVMSFELPQRVGGQVRRRIARQQLSDRLGASGADCVIVPLTLASKGDNTWSRAVVVDREKLTAWTGAADKGKRCRALLPDYFTLPAAPDVVVVESRDDTILARIGIEDGFMAPASVAAAALKLALSGAEVTKAHLIGSVPVDCRAALRAAGIADAESSPGAAFSHGELDLDLRQARHYDEASGPQGFGLWLTAAAIAFLAFGLWIASVMVETRAIAAQTNDLMDRTTELLRDGLIPEGPILDIRAQVARAISDAEPDTSAASQVGVAALLSEITVALFGRGVRVSELAIEGNGMTVEILAPDFAAAEVVQSQLRDAGLSVSAESSRRTDSGVAVRLDVVRTGEEQP